MPDVNVNVLQTLIQFRRGTEEQWNLVKDSYIPRAGEPCVTLDGKNRGQIKVGDGENTWGNLKYVGVAEGALKFKGSVDTKAELPESAEIGDIYQVIEDSTMYIWDGDSWEIFHAIDLSKYATKEEFDNAVELFNTYINDINFALQGYALKEELDVIKVYGNDFAEDTSMTVDGIEYATASEAIAAVGEGGTVKMSGGLAPDEVITADKKFILDMNNAIIVDDEKTPVSVNATGDLTLTGNGSVECNKNGLPAVNNKGKMTIENGSYTRTVDEKNNSFYTMVNHGEMVVNDGVFEAPGVVSSMIENGYQEFNKQYVAGQSAEYPSLTINGGTYINAFYAIKNDDNGKLYINGGNFFGTIFHNGYEMIINGGNFNVTDGSYNIGMRKLNESMNAGTIEINGGTFVSNGSCNMKVNAGDEPSVVIKGGKFSHEVPENYIADGYEQTLVNGYYEVSKKA